MKATTPKTEFTCSPSHETTVQPTVLHAAHLKRTKVSHLAPFAGYQMPLWFSSIKEEHQAVRTSMGLFDCTHMGIFSVQGADATDFLNAVLTNDVSRIRAGQAQYASLLDAHGQVLDDVIIYCRASYDYLLVANAANKHTVDAYLQGLSQDLWIIDTEQPERCLGYHPKIQYPALGPDQDPWVDIALQGPRSGQLLQRLLGESEPVPASVKNFFFFEGTLQKIPCLITRTGYTGARLGFEIFVGQSYAEELWELILEQGQALGLLPCGLGARDSLRIEAGLPLFGHELAGPHHISPLEAGYGWAVKTEKPFFVGQAAMQIQLASPARQVQRLSFVGGRGIRPIRSDDAVLNNAGHCIGWVLSATGIGDQQIALALIYHKPLPVGTNIGLYYLARNEGQISKRRKTKVERNEQVVADITGQIMPRFARF